MRKLTIAASIKTKMILPIIEAFTDIRFSVWLSTSFIRGSQKKKSDITTARVVIKTGLDNLLVMLVKVYLYLTKHKIHHD